MSLAGSCKISAIDRRLQPHSKTRQSNLCYPHELRVPNEHANNDEPSRVASATIDLQRDRSSCGKSPAAIGRRLNSPAVLLVSCQAAIREFSRRRAFRPDSGLLIAGIGAATTASDDARDNARLLPCASGHSEPWVHTACFFKLVTPGCPSRMPSWSFPAIRSIGFPARRYAVRKPRSSGRHKFLSQSDGEHCAPMPCSRSLLHTFDSIEECARQSWIRNRQNGV